MPFLSLNDYALIGNRTSAALVSRLGSIDWCCLPFLDSPSHFAGLLDSSLGGRFQISPQGDSRSEQRYLQRTQIVETIFETPHGRAVLTDWMPLEAHSQLEPVIHRRLEVISGRISWTAICSPRFSYGAEGAQAEIHHDGILFRGSHGEICQLEAQVPLEISENGSAAVARFTAEPGKPISFEWSWGRRAARATFPEPRVSAETWRGWAHKCAGDSVGCVFAGPWHDVITRASLLVKLMSTPFSGAIAEAVTTSLPEIPGVNRTWDYRYAWLRDSSSILRALRGLGFDAEAHAYFRFLSDVVIRDGAEGLQAVYTLDGGRFLPEQDLPHLAGYHGARPVRVGNQSSRQFHLDIYGHVMLAAHEYMLAYGPISDRLWDRLAETADYVCQAWRRPDHGPWDVRGKPEHFVASKLLCWAALDRARKIGHALGKRVPPRWEQERKVLHHTICLQGYDETKGAFIGAFGTSELDSTTLLIPLLGFLPFDDPRVAGTIDAIRAELSEGVLVYRHQTGAEAYGGDAPHLWSSFLFISCLAAAGRADEASDRLGELCTYSTPLGFFGEQIHPATGEMAGNFPSVSATIGMIHAALNVGLARGRKLPPIQISRAA